MDPAPGGPAPRSRRRVTGANTVHQTANTVHQTANTVHQTANTVHQTANTVQLSARIPKSPFARATPTSSTFPNGVSRGRSGLRAPYPLALSERPATPRDHETPGPDSRILPDALSAATGRHRGGGAQSCLVASCRPAGRYCAHDSRPKRGPGTCSKSDERGNSGGSMGGAFGPWGGAVARARCVCAESSGSAYS